MKTLLTVIACLVGVIATLFALVMVASAGSMGVSSPFGWLYLATSVALPISCFFAVVQLQGRWPNRPWLAWAPVAVLTLLVTELVVAPFVGVARLLLR